MLPLLLLLLLLVFRAHFPLSLVASRRTCLPPLQSQRGDGGDRLQARRIVELESDLHTLSKRLKAEEAASEVVIKRLQEQVRLTEQARGQDMERADAVRAELNALKQEVEARKTETSQRASERQAIDAQRALLKDSQAALDSQQALLKVGECCGRLVGWLVGWLVGRLSDRLQWGGRGLLVGHCGGYVSSVIDAVVRPEHIRGQLDWAYFVRRVTVVPCVCNEPFISCVH